MFGLDQRGFPVERLLLLDNTTTTFNRQLQILAGLLLGFWLLISLLHIGYQFPADTTASFDSPAYCGVGFRTLTGLQGNHTTLISASGPCIGFGIYFSVDSFNYFASPAHCGVGFRTLTGLQGHHTTLVRQLGLNIGLHIQLFVTPTDHFDFPANCGVGFRTLTGLQGNHRKPSKVFTFRIALASHFSVDAPDSPDSLALCDVEEQPLPALRRIPKTPFRRLSATYCGFGSVFPLTGLLLERLLTGYNFSFSQINPGFFFWDQQFFWHSVSLSIPDSRVTLCGVGSWFKLAGLLLDCACVQGLGTLAVCPTTACQLFFILWGWAPACWLALAGFLYLVTRLVFRFASFFWRLLHWINRLILIFKRSHTLLLAKSALGWFCDFRHQQTTHSYTTQPL